MMRSVSVSTYSVVKIHLKPGGAGNGTMVIVDTPKNAVCLPFVRDESCCCSLKWLKLGRTVRSQERWPAGNCHTAIEASNPDRSSSIRLNIPHFDSQYEAICEKMGLRSTISVQILLHTAWDSRDLRSSTLTAWPPDKGPSCLVV
jgi:hypothetical protein